MTLRPALRAIASSTALGFAVALVAPVALTLATNWLHLPPFVFEDLGVLLVLAVAVPWGLGPAVVAAIVCVASDNVLLHEPLGAPTITGNRDVLDLVLFATVAIVASGLVTRAHAARRAALDAAERERRARADLDRLITTVTHDLATPLSVLRGSVQFARMQGAVDVDWSRLLNRLDTASARATSLVRMLSDARALEAENPGLLLSTHDLRALVTPIVEMMDRLSERHPVMLSVPQAPVPVRADADRLQRVLENLVNNAIKYSPDGGAVEVSVDSEGTEAVLRVRDYGIGISPEALPHIFERSFRAPEAVPHAHGLGLGLSIAAQVVARHGGTISASCEDGPGTTVVVRLPLATDTMASGDRQQVAEPLRA